MKTIPRIGFIGIFLLLGVVFSVGNVNAYVSLMQTTGDTSSGQVGPTGDKSQGLGTGLSGSFFSVQVKATASGTGTFQGWLYECPNNDGRVCSGGTAIATLDDNPTAGNQSITVSDVALTTYTLYPVGTASFDSTKYYFLSFAGGTTNVSLYETTSNNYSNGSCTKLNAGNYVACDNSVLDLYFIVNDPLTTTNYVEIIKPVDGSQTGYIDNFDVKYKYSNTFYNLYNNREIKLYISNNNGLTFPYTSTKTFISTQQEQTINIPAPEDLGFDDYVAYAELWINDTKVFTSQNINFSTVSVITGDLFNPYERLSPSSSSYVLGRLTLSQASISKSTCGGIFADSESYLGAGIAYGACLAGSFMFEPSQYSVNFVKGQLYRLAVSFPFDYITTGFEMSTALLTDDFIASSSNSSVSLGFSIDFRGLDTSTASSRSFGTGEFDLMSSGMFDNVGNTGNSLMPIINTLRTIMVALLYLSYTTSVIYIVSRYFSA